MPPPRPVPNVLFDDTGGDLTDHQQGGNQLLVGANQIYLRAAPISHRWPDDAAPNHDNRNVSA
jgi:hypothetical protein